MLLVSQPNMGKNCPKRLVVWLATQINDFYIGGLLLSAVLGIHGRPWNASPTVTGGGQSEGNIYTANNEPGSCILGYWHVSKSILLCFKLRTKTFFSECMNKECNLISA